MASDYPKFNGFSLQDDNFITSEILYRNTPIRSIDAQKLARKPGVRLLAHEYAERKVTLRGHVIATDATELQSKIDELHLNVTSKEDGILEVSSLRQATATVVSVGVGDPHYAQDYVPMDIEFILADPFFYHPTPHGHSWTVAGSTTSMTRNLTVSGSVFAEPTVTYQAPTGGGDTNISSINVVHLATGEVITWSGTAGTGKLAYSEAVVFDYANKKILQGTTSVSTSGVFSRWEPGSQDFIVYFTGTVPADGVLSITYQPRYL